jgi:hypothetical protein
MDRRVVAFLARRNAQDESGGAFRGPSTASERSRRDNGKHRRLMAVRKGLYANRLPLNPIIEVPLRNS